MRRALAAPLSVLFSAVPLHTCGAVEFECRIVEQVGPRRADIAVLENGRIVVRPGSSHRLRIQFRAIPEPDEQIVTFIGWFNGSITATGGTNTRTAFSSPPPRGNLPPFNASGAPAAEGIPADDPFTRLDAISCHTGVEQPVWLCTPKGGIPDAPMPPSRGVGDFVSTYEITTVAGSTSYSITCTGDAVAGTEWRTTGCVAPECGDPGDPSDDMPGVCVYTPFPGRSQPFSTTLHVVVCPAEWNDDRAVTSQDFFDFLADFFAGEADFNGDGATTSADFFDYLAAYFTPC